MTRKTWAGVRRAMGHTRLVPAGNPPLYRLILMALCISSVLQLIYGEPPVSVRSVAAAWYDYAFVLAQAFGSALCIIGLYMIDGNRLHATRLYQSLGVEFTGLLIVQTCIIANTTAVWFYYDRPPTAPASWIALGFSLWAWFRMWDIRRTMKGLAR